MGCLTCLAGNRCRWNGLCNLLLSTGIDYESKSNYREGRKDFFFHGNPKRTDSNFGNYSLLFLELYPGRLYLSHGTLAHAR